MYLPVVLDINKISFVINFLMYWLINFYNLFYVDAYVQNNEDLDLVVIEHMAYGKGFIKTCKVCYCYMFQNLIGNLIIIALFMNLSEKNNLRKGLGLSF